MDRLGDIARKSTDRHVDKLRSLVRLDRAVVRNTLEPALSAILFARGAK